jgi:hypothetical protein
MKSRSKKLAASLLIPLFTGSPGFSANLALESNNAILTDAHNTVFKRDFIDWDRDKFGDPQPAKIGDLLKEGMQVGTGSQSWAQISWPKVTTRTWENSVVSIAPNKKIVYLREGEMLFQRDNKQHQDQFSYVIWTKVLQVRVRGTTLLVQATPEYSRVSVLEGDVDVVNRLDNSVVNIRPGVVYEVRTGAPPNSLPPKAATPQANQEWQQYWGNQFVTPNPISTNRTGTGGQSYSKQPWSGNAVQTTTAKAGGPSSNDFERWRQKIKNEVKGPQDVERLKNQMKSEGWTESDMQRLKQTIEGDGWRMPNNGQGNWQQQPWQQKQQWQQQEHWKQKQGWKGALPLDSNKIVQDSYIPAYLMSHDTAGSAFELTGYEQQQVVSSDTSELARLNYGVNNMPNTNTTAPVSEISNWNAPPLSVFRTSQSATNLYLADTVALMNHPLIRQFRDALGSLPEMQSALTRYSPISQGAMGPDRMRMRNLILSQSAQVISAPTVANFQPGPQMGYRYAMPSPATSTCLSK